MIGDVLYWGAFGLACVVCVTVADRLLAGRERLEWKQFMRGAVR